MGNYTVSWVYRVVARLSDKKAKVEGARSKRTMEIDFTTQVWKEGKVYVSYAKELDISSFGKTIKEAKKNLIEAVECFLETAEEMGTLDEILEEAM